MEALDTTSPDDRAACYGRPLTAPRSDRDAAIDIRPEVEPLNAFFPPVLQGLEAAERTSSTAAAMIDIAELSPRPFGVAAFWRPMSEKGVAFRFSPKEGFLIAALAERGAPSPRLQTAGLLRSTMMGSVNRDSPCRIACSRTAIASSQRSVLSPAPRPAQRTLPTSSPPSEPRPAP